MPSRVIDLGNMTIPSILNGGNASGKQDFSDYLKIVPNTNFRTIGFTNEGLWLYDAATVTAKLYNSSGILLKTINQPVSNFYPFTVTSLYIIWVYNASYIVTDHNGTIVINSSNETAIITYSTINEKTNEIYNFISSSGTLTIRNFSTTLIKQHTISTTLPGSLIPIKDGVILLTPATTSFYCTNTSSYTFINSNLLTNILNIGG